jgi:hypothetical protein
MLHDKPNLSAMRLDVQDARPDPERGAIGLRWQRRRDVAGVRHRPEA